MPRRNPPQMVINSRMLYFGWIPENADALRRVLPPGLRPIDDAQVFMNQYVVDSAEQTSGFGAYSLTCAGLDLDRTAPDGATPSRWWTHYFNSSPDMFFSALARSSGAESRGFFMMKNANSGTMVISRDLCRYRFPERDQRARWNSRSHL